MSGVGVQMRVLPFSEPPRCVAYLAGKVSVTEFTVCTALFLWINFGLRVIILGPMRVSLPVGWWVGSCSAAAIPVSTMATKVKILRVIRTLGFIASLFEVKDCVVISLLGGAKIMVLEGSLQYIEPIFAEYYIEKMLLFITIC